MTAKIQQPDPPVLSRLEKKPYYPDMVIPFCVPGSLYEGYNFWLAFNTKMGDDGVKFETFEWLEEDEDKGELVDSRTFYRFVDDFVPGYVDLWGLETLSINVYSGGNEYYLFLSGSIWAGEGELVDAVEHAHKHDSIYYVQGKKLYKRLRQCLTACLDAVGFKDLEHCPLHQKQVIYKIIDELDAEEIANPWITDWWFDKASGLPVYQPDYYDVKSIARYMTVVCSPPKIRESTFSFDETVVLDELHDQAKWHRKIESYRLHKKGMGQDTIKLKYDVTQACISKWVTQTRGELSRRMGIKYEKFRAGKLSIRPDVDRVELLAGKSQPDLIVHLKNGSAEFYSIKCYISDRRSISIPGTELAPEYDAALAAQRKGVAAKLFIDFYNLHNHFHETREIDMDQIPRNILFVAPNKTVETTP